MDNNGNKSISSNGQVMLGAVAVLHIGRQGAGPVCLGEEVDISQRDEQPVVGDHWHPLVFHGVPVPPLLFEMHCLESQ